MATPANNTSEATAVVVASKAALAAVPTTSRALTMRAQMEAEAEVRLVVKEFVERHMIDGTDYGVIPGTPKPTLLKPGAEKLIDLFRAVPEMKVVSRIEDWDRAPALFHYEFEYSLRDRDGNVLAVGVGSANSREGRYRWRNGERKCPACGKATIIKGKQEYGGGFVCFAKKGGCGAKYKDDDKQITDQVVGKVENDDVETLANTVLKMAKKRAQVDAAIALARCSDLFTQDVEDLADPDHAERSGRRREEPAQQNGNAAKAAPAGNGKASGPEVFMPHAKWEGAEQWNGKLLADAPVGALRPYLTCIVEVAGRTTAPKAQEFLALHMKHIEAAIKGEDPPPAEPTRPSSPGTEPAPKAQKPKAARGGTGDQAEPAAAFSKRIPWDGAEQWTGRALTDADLDTLTVYAEAVHAALNDPAQESYHVNNTKHLALVDAAIASKEPPR